MYLSQCERQNYTYISVVVVAATGCSTAAISISVDAHDPLEVCVHVSLELLSALEALLAHRTQAERLAELAEAVMHLHVTRVRLRLELVVHLERLGAHVARAIVRTSATISAAVNCTRSKSVRVVVVRVVVSGHLNGRVAHLGVELLLLAANRDQIHGVVVVVVVIISCVAHERRLEIARNILDLKVIGIVVLVVLLLRGISLSGMSGVCGSHGGSSCGCRRGRVLCRLLHGHLDVLLLGLLAQLLVHDLYVHLEIADASKRPLAQLTAVLALQLLLLTGQLDAQRDAVDRGRHAVVVLVVVAVLVVVIVAVEAGGGGGSGCRRPLVVLALAAVHVEDVAAELVAVDEHLAALLAYDVGVDGVVRVVGYHVAAQLVVVGEVEQRVRVVGEAIEHIEGRGRRCAV